MVDALRGTHESLVDGGALLDMRPTHEEATIFDRAGARALLDDTVSGRDLAPIEAGLQATIRDGLYAVEAELIFDQVHWFADATRLLAESAQWRTRPIPPSLRQAVERGHPPFEVHRPCRLQRLRARPRARPGV